MGNVDRPGSAAEHGTSILKHKQWKEAWKRIEQFERGECTSLDTLPTQRRGGDVAADDARAFEDDRDDDDVETYALVIVGEAGTGKTWLVNAFKRQKHLASDFSNPDNDIRPVVRVVTPDMPTPKSIMTEICAQLNAPPKSKASTSQISAHLRSLCNDLGVKFILMDEAHALVDQQSPKKIQEMARFLKFLMIETGVPLILAGEEPIKALISPKYKALYRRLVAPIELKAYGWGDYSESAQFMLMAEKIAIGLGFPDWHKFSDSDLGVRLYYESRGVIGLLVKQIRGAVEIARANGSKKLTALDFAVAYEKWRPNEVARALDPFALGSQSDTRTTKNPYSCSTEELKLLWQERFHPLVEEDRSERTRRYSTSKKPGITSFGK